MKRSPMPPRKTELRRTEFKRSTTSSLLRSSLPSHRNEPRRTTEVRRKSIKRQREEPIYNRLAKAFLAEHERCQWPAGCAFPSQQVHHRKGRVGALYLDQSHWSALCVPHHSWATEHPAAAIDMGVSERRVGAA